MSYFPFSKNTISGLFFGWMMWGSWESSWITLLTSPSTKKKMRIFYFRTLSHESMKLASLCVCKRTRRTMFCSSLEFFRALWFWQLFTATSVSIYTSDFLSLDFFYACSSSFFASLQISSPVSPFKGRMIGALFGFTVQSHGKANFRGGEVHFRY